ncbi:MAG: hypothetical protein ACM3ME_10945, partial [Chloroflexota bacterium]
MATKSLRPIFQAFMVCFLMIPVWTFSRDAPVTNIGNVAACQGITTPVPFTVTGFTDVSAITLRIEYNPQILDYISYANTNPVFTGMMINDVAVSATVRKVVIVWSDINPVTLIDGSKIVDLNFSMIAGTMGTISFNNIANGGQDCEYADENADPMNDIPTSNFYIGGTFSGLNVGAAGSITGVSNVCISTTGVQYSINSVTNATGYTWSVPPGCTIVSGQNTSQITVDYPNYALTGNINVYASNSCGNSNTSTIPVTVNALPIPGLTGDIEVCRNDANIVYSTEPGMTNYEWNVTGGSITAGGTPVSNTVTVTWPSSVAGNVSVNYIDAKGCSAIAPTVLNVTVNPLPVPELAGDNHVCLNDAGVVYTTAPGMSNYVWNVTGGTITSGGLSTNNSATITWNNFGIGTVSVSYTNENGCKAATPTIMYVTVEMLPIPSLEGDNIVCEGESGVVYSTQSGMTGYLWNISGGTITSGGTTASNTATVTWNTPGAGNISVNYTNSNGCFSVSPAALNVTINPLPVPVIAGDNAVCAGDMGVVYTTEAGMTGYNWVVTGGTVTSGGTSTSSLVTVNWLNAGSGSITVNYVNANGCTAVAPTIYNVTINPLPVPVITGDNAVCVGDAGVAYITESGMSDYVWDVIGGTIISGGTMTSNTATITWNTAGAGTVSVGYTNGNGCTSLNATIYNVTVNSLPIPVLSGVNNVCINEASTYTTESGMSNYNWSVSGGLITAGGTSTSNTVTVFWDTPGAGTVSVNYTNANGCTAADPSLLDVTVNPLPVATLAGDNFVCTGEAGFVYTTEAGMTGYQWSITGGTITAGGTSTSNTATITWNTAGAQSVVVSYANSNGCISIPVTYNVTVNPLPVPTIAGDNSVCIGDAGVVYTTENGMTGYSWNVTGGTITAGGTAISNTATVTWNSSGVGTVSVNYTNANLCTATTVTV